MPHDPPEPPADPAPGTAAPSPPPHGPARSRWHGASPWSWLVFVPVVLASMVFTGLGAALVLGWAAATGTPWRDLGYVRPRSWARTLLAGIVIGALFKLVMKSLVMPLLGATPVNRAFQQLAGDASAVPGFLFTLIVGAGFGEETLYRGYLFERLGRLLGTAPAARAATVVLTTALFAAAHWSGQGLPGTEQAAVTGLVFGTIYAATGRLPFVMVAHTAFDLMAYALIYWRLETGVGHWFFR